MRKRQKSFQPCAKTRDVSGTRLADEQRGVMRMFEDESLVAPPAHGERFYETRTTESTVVSLVD